MYVQEGDDLDGFRVTSIEKDMIRLDCQGEERIATLNSAYYKQEVCATERINETMDKMEVDEEYKLEKNIKEVDDSHVVAAVGDEIVEENERVISNVFDEPFNPMSMAHESLFMPVLNDIKASGSDEIQEAADTLPDIEVDNIVHSDKVLQVAMVEPADSIYMVLDEERLKQKALSEVPTQIILKGIVIAGNIRKAMVNVPMSKISKNRTLYVEEGDGLEGYLVTRIESMQIRLDWHGKETIVAFQGSY